jgi:hypothetical protein
MRHTILIVSSCFVMLSLSACALVPASIEPAMFEAEPLKGDPVITFSTTNEMLLIDIASPTGIGGAAIEKTAGQWPSQIVMRLRVSGLESFTFRYADTTIRVSVSSHGDNVVHEESNASGALHSDDAEWIAVTPGEGYFDLEAPADFFKSGENTFTIEWIDFYR